MFIEVEFSIEILPLRDDIVNICPTSQYLPVLCTEMRFIGSFVRPSVMRRASCMGSQKWQILPFIFLPSLSPITFQPSTISFTSDFSPPSSHFSPPPFPSHFLPLNSHFPISLFTPQLSFSPITFQPSPLTFPSHFSPLNAHFLLSIFTSQL